MSNTEPKELQCDMYAGCNEEVTHLDTHGFIYCEHHGVTRRNWMPCRKMRGYELNRLKAGKQITRY